MQEPQSQYDCVHNMFVLLAMLLLIFYLYKQNQYMKDQVAMTAVGRVMTAADRAMTAVGRVMTAVGRAMTAADRATTAAGRMMTVTHL